LTTPFARKLTALRAKAGLSQYRLARLTGLSKQTLSVLEKGDRSPTWDTLQLICLALGVDCRAFADDGLKLPGADEAQPVGRPRKGVGKEKSRKKGK
jgi:transcriptional regulator with XRE-family HTH domain